MIESRTRDSGSFNQDAQAIDASEFQPENNNRSIVNPLIDTLFASKYLILEVLGEGGMSVVYLARHEALNRLVAIKTLHAHLMSKNTSLLRFKQEAQAASRLEHPGIVAMHDYGVTEEGTPYIVMDYVSGESLSDLLSRAKSIPLLDALDIFKQTAAAIAHAHERGIVHRDIKPSNIMLNFDEHNRCFVKIVDFGVAKSIEEDQSSKLTQTGESLGSPLYMSPEQCMGGQLDARSDIYSFGCVMYEALTGSPALASDSVFKTMMKHIHDVPASFKEVQPDLQCYESLERIVFKALAKDPSKRYQQMNELLADLNNLHEKQNFAQKLFHKFELTGLRQTTKSLNFMVASSVALGAIILIGASFGLTMLSGVSNKPDFQSEAPPWPAYQDKVMSQTRDDQEEHQIALDSLQSLVIESDEQAVRTANRQQSIDKQIELAFERRSKATATRNHHEYEQAQTEFTTAIEYIKNALSLTKGVQTADGLNNLMLGYIGKGDCEYFKSPPDYKSAAEDYSKAKVLLRKIRTNSIWTALGSVEQLYFLLRSADCYFMQGRYQQASSARSIIEEITRSAKRVIKDATYRALTESKIAEELFRLGKLQDAEEEYKLALKDWSTSGDNFLRERVMIEARLAEIRDAGKSGDDTDAYADFVTLASSLAQKDPEAMHSKFIADAYQSYAHYLWMHGDFKKALDMHQLAVKYGKK